MHRREIFGDKLIQILKSFKKLATKYKDIIFVYSVHLNPNIKKFVFRELKLCKNFILLPPIDYLSFIYIMQRSYLIMSDSGGIQEEAPSFHVPIIILRDVTERQELINSSQGILAGTNVKKIIKIFEELVNNKKKYNALKSKINPFGDGKASKKIKVFLEKLL
jgi:UDP-N-acetylglucosamine 2-epimerase (non-hydrolysing)